MTQGLILALALAASPAPSVGGLVDQYLERYFHTFPSRATEAGRHDLDRQLEDLSPESRTAWRDFNRDVRDRLQKLTRGARPLALDAQLDSEALLAQVQREIHAHDVLRRPERDPLYWTSMIANATVFLLVREDRPLAERLDAARARVALLPRLALQAREALAETPADEISAELCRIAADQARASATFAREGLVRASQSADGSPAPELRGATEPAARALNALATFLDELGAKAKGSSRLGGLYAEAFRVGTGVEEPVSQVLARAEAALVSKRTEAAAFGRGAWAELVPGEAAPADDRALLRRLFERVAADRDREIPEYEDGWRANVRDLEAFVRDRDVMTLPDPLTLTIGRSPSFFVGQSVGGVYPAGPYAPEAPTLLFLPMPADNASPAQRETFFRAFNRPFNKMIAPHELLPGHYTQLKFAARHPHKVRALFPDPVYVEGWGTFCERLLLDLGWGDPSLRSGGASLARLAHLKKQLENAARVIVDVRVHTLAMTREEVLRFVKEDALQDEQFATNMWTRALTSSPQITTYLLGDLQVQGLYDDMRAAQGARFRLRTFMDGMMAMGPVPVRRYRERLLPRRGPRVENP